MKTHVLRGSKEEIAERLVQLNGEEPGPAARGEETQDAQDIFAEMRAFMVDVPDEDSREAVYSRMDGE
jgi:hypothetical protein